MAQDTFAGPRLIVAGEGEVAARPDMAVVSLAVLREAETASSAFDSASSAMREVIAAMKAAGIADRDLQTSGLAVQPRYTSPGPERSGEAPRIAGYEVRQSLTVRVRDLERLGAVIDEAVSLGVNQAGGIHFALADPDTVLTEARQKAVADALARAEALAEAAGVTLGPIREITEHMVGGPPVPKAASAMMRDMAEAMPVEAGEIDYRAQVTITFEIGSAR
jgi:uncharacterized protein YggE